MVVYHANRRGGSTAQTTSVCFMRMGPICTRISTREPILRSVLTEGVNGFHAP